MPSPRDPAALPVTPERISRLRSFGLSEYAARAYLALLELGTTEARDVSAVSKVPASKIYHILDQLHEKGLVAVLPEFPRKYAPIPFREFLARIHDEHAAAARDIEAHADELADLFAVSGATTASDRGACTIYHGRRNARARALEIVAAASEDVLLLPTAHEATDLRLWREALDAARGRGVRVRLLDAGARPRGLPGATFALLIDGQRALLGHAVPDDGHATEGSDTALDVDQEGIVALLAGLLEAHWPRDGTLVRVLGEAPNDPPPTLVP